MLKQTLALVGLTISLSANAALVNDVTGSGDSFIYGNYFTPNPAYDPDDVFNLEPEFFNNQYIVSISPATNYTMSSYYTVDEVNFVDYTTTSYETTVIGRWAWTDTETVMTVDSCTGTYCGSVSSSTPTVRLSNENTLWLYTNLGGIGIDIMVGEQISRVDYYNSLYGYTVPSEVPIPAAAWLFGSALVGLAGIKRRK